MARLALVALLMTSACSLYYGDSKAATDASAASQREQDFANEVLPILDANCGACHATTTGGALDFLSGSSPAQILANLEQDGLIDQAVPPDSLLLRIGPHEGPVLNSDAQTVILDWLNQY